MKNIILTWISKQISKPIGWLYIHSEWFRKLINEETIYLVIEKDEKK